MMRAVVSGRAESITGICAALGHFRDAKQGEVIVNNASVLGWRAQHSQSHYAAAKAGVMALTRCSAIEAVDYGDVRAGRTTPSST